MSKRKYKKPEPESPITSTVSTLPTDRPVAVYYRQSTEAQVGNVSTTIQTVDMVEHLKRRGWDEASIIMIDMDAGISGTTKIDERPGMKTLFSLITDGKLGTVACQDEDRLFRDVTQIQVNIFIEACRSNQVMVLTPSMIYDFAHAQMGTFHARQFRFKSEMSAEYITSYIKGKLHPAKRRLMSEGRWAGGSIPPGFMIDIRKSLPDGSRNENWRRYVPHPALAEIVNQYFRLFLDNAGNMRATTEYIRNHGPYYPNPHTLLAPDGYRIEFPYLTKNYGRGYCPGRTGLYTLLTNAAYIGHWVVKDEIVKWSNHPAIVPLDIFMEAFNYLSPVTLDGKPNVHYKGFQTKDHTVKGRQRPVDRPLCAGMIFTIVNGKRRKAGTNYVGKYQHYSYYLLLREPTETVLWSKKADYVDEAVIERLQEKLLLTFDPAEWDRTLAEFKKDFAKECRLKSKQLQALETTMKNLLTSLETLKNPQLIQKVEQRFEEAEVEYSRLQGELEAAENEILEWEALSQLKGICGPALHDWSQLTRKEKRNILHSFIEWIEAVPLEAHALQLTVIWRDGSFDELRIARKGTTYTGWLVTQEELLQEMLRDGAPQLELCAAFPNRKWLSIREKIASLVGRDWPLQGASPIKDQETYQDYCQRVAKSPTIYRARSGERWKQGDIQLLNTLIESGASQVEIAKAFPHRNWARIRAKITNLWGSDVSIPGAGEKNGEAGEVHKYETYQMYCLRTQDNNEAGEDSSSDSVLEANSKTAHRDATMTLLPDAG